MRLSALSKVYLRYTVKAKLLGVDYNPTGDVVQFAIIAQGTVLPASPTWVAGSWETLPQQINGTFYVARVLVGPGTSFVLTPGDYAVYCKIIDTTENPVELVGNVTIF